MKPLPATAFIAIALALAGCSASLPSSPSKVPKSDSARQIADRIDGCTHIAEVLALVGLAGGTAAEQKQLARSDTAASCDFHRVSVMIESNPDATEPQTAMPASPSDYVLVGTTWSIHIVGIGLAAPAVSLTKQLAELTTIQSKLGGKILLYPQAKSAPRAGATSGVQEI